MTRSLVRARCSGVDMAAAAAVPPPLRHSPCARRMQVAQLTGRRLSRGLSSAGALSSLVTHRTQS
jgi:hypothetical protein